MGNFTYLFTLFSRHLERNARKVHISQNKRLFIIIFSALRTKKRLFHFFFRRSQSWEESMCDKELISIPRNQDDSNFTTPVPKPLFVRFSKTVYVIMLQKRKCLSFADFSIYLRLFENVDSRILNVFCLLRKVWILEECPHEWRSLSLNFPKQRHKSKWKYLERP